MATKVQRRNGGYFTVPNRWIDAGYMAAAPGSVTQVYLHLSRWADNGTLESSQPMKLIAKKCGLSEDVVRGKLAQVQVSSRVGAWLATTAHRRAIDVLRRRRTEADRMRDLTAWARRQTSAELEPDADDVMELAERHREQHR